MNIDFLATEVADRQEILKSFLSAGQLDDWLTNLPKYVTAVEKLRSRLVNEPEVTTQNPLVKKLIGSFDRKANEGDDKFGSDLLFSWFSPAEYGQRYLHVELLISPLEIPFHLRCFLAEARQCYALNQCAAVHSLSRTILEAAVTDIAYGIGMIPHGIAEDVVFKKFPPKRRICAVAQQDFQEVYQHYTRLCRVVHGNAVSTDDGPLLSLLKTIGFVQHLYELNHDRMICRTGIKPTLKH